MTTPNQSVVIEIPEEAYRQNTIYTPWPVVKASEVEASPESESPSEDTED